MPMLDEQEYAEIASLHRLGMRSVKDHRSQTGAPLKSIPLAKHFAPLLTRYEGMTDYRETNPNAVMHHRLRCTVLFAHTAANLYGRLRQGSVAAV